MGSAGMRCGPGQVLEHAALLFHSELHLMELSAFHTSVPNVRCGSGSLS